MCVFRSGQQGRIRFSRTSLTTHTITRAQDVHPKVQVTATAEGSVKSMQDYKIGFGAVLG